MQYNATYSDGLIEDKIISYLQNHEGDTSNIIDDLPEGAVFHNFTDARSNLIAWYPFTKQDDVLEIGAGMGALTNCLADRCNSVVALEPSKERAKVASLRCQRKENVRVICQGIEDYNEIARFDYVLLIGVLEYAGITVKADNPWEYMLQLAKRFLKPTGKLLVAIENQFGLKYWCGAAEDHTGVPFDSINLYQKSEGQTNRYHDKHGVRTFSKKRLEELLRNTGFERISFYYPFPDYKFPMLILNDRGVNTALLGDVKFSYPEESTLIANEQELYPEIVENDCLGFFANSFFVEAGQTESSDIQAVVLKRDYRAEYGIATIIRDNRVTRCALTNEAVPHLNSLVENTELLMARGVPCVKQEAVMHGESYAEKVMAQRADQIFAQAIAENNMLLAFNMVDKLCDYLRKSSKIDYCQGQAVLKDAFIDLTFRNSFWINNDLIFFDQEWKKCNVSFEFVLFRSLQYVLSCNEFATQRRQLIKKYNLSKEKLNMFECMEREFLDSLMDERKTSWFDKTMFQERLLYKSKIDVELSNRDAHIEQLLESERNLKRGLEEKEIAYAQMVEEKDAAYAQMVEEKDTAYAQMVSEKDAAYAQMVEEKEEQRQAEKAELLQQICNKEGHIAQLLESDRELERIKTSRSWRFMGYVWKLRDALIPKGSKRRLFGKMLVKFVKHPIRFLRKCTPTRIGKFFSNLRREGVEGTSRRLDDCLIGNEIQKQELQIIDMGTEKAAAKTLADYAQLTVPQWVDPQVSIIIPVYNQFEYTYLCIQSILKNSGDIRYEILIADDCSNDLTVDIEQVISGLRVIRNAENLRFLRNCNNAAKYAKGQYILFLNNDTQVQENWLAPLVELIERDERIGMVGSKLVYPDGRLQEAGGILWKDGSAWNYGNRSDPDLPEYNYVKEVDYISGAAIMIRRELWEEIGGFDERFAPAYCEDSDLAFEVRKHGYKVMYQPKSVVVHFEGVSNGTDTSSGQKAYQVTNQKKFFEKWEAVLQKDHLPNGINSFLARDRSTNKKVLLMIDHYVPQFDKDAGSKTVFQYLQLFVREGFSVKFIGDNFYPHQPYTEVLQQMGVEVLYGPYYAQHWKDWLKENGKNIGYVFLNRPHISVKYIDELRKWTKANIIYYGHDLHFLREKREYDLTGDAALLKSSQEWKEKELHLMRAADMAYYPSCVEVEEIHHAAPDIKVKAIPAYLFTNIQEEDYNYDARQNLMFIGGFGHRPNVDAVVWLANEIMPRLLELLPDICVYILGSNPPEEVKKLNSTHLQIKGFVSDQELEEYYHKCRLSIVPLRYGAGIKGKVIEAMRYGMPVMTTSIGAEGIQNAEGILEIADDAKAFAEKLAALYQNAEELFARSKASYRYVRENFSFENARQVIAPEFDLELSK